MTGDWRDTSVPRHAELERLREAWHQARLGVPQVAAIVAESGYGKTRLAQDFFAWLSREVDAPEPEGYWPDRLGRNEDNLRVNPVMTGLPVGHADMPFLWWGVRIADPGRRNQQFSSALSHAKFDLADHLVRFTISEAERERALETASARRKLALDLGIDFAGNLMSFGLLGVLKNISEFRSEIQDIEGRFGAAVSGASSQDVNLVNLILEDLRRICLPSTGGKASLPLVVLIDDAHWLGSDPMMGTMVQRLIETAVAEDWPLLLLLTSWEREWSSHLQRQLVLAGARPAAIPVGPLDLGAIVRAALPGLTAAQGELVTAAVDGNPLFGTYLLEALQGDNAHFVGRSPTGPLSAIGEDFVRTATIQDIVERRFVDSPSEMQKVLGLAALQGIRFSPALALRTAAILGDQADQAILAQADQPFAFVSIRSAAEAEFRQRRLREAARKRLRHFIDEEEARQALDQAMASPELAGSENGLEIIARDVDHSDPVRRAAGMNALVALVQRAVANYDKVSASYAAGLFLDRALADKPVAMHSYGAYTIYNALGGSGRHVEAAELYFHYYRITRPACTIDGVFDPAAHGGIYRALFSDLADVLPRIVTSLDRDAADLKTAQDAARIGVDLRRAEIAGVLSGGEEPAPYLLRSLRVSLQRLSDLTPAKEALPLIEEQLELATTIASSQTAYESAPDLSNTLLRYANALRAAGRDEEQRRVLERRVEIWEQAVEAIPDLRNIHKLLSALIDLRAGWLAFRVSAEDAGRIAPILRLGYKAYYAVPGNLDILSPLAQLLWPMGRRLRKDTPTRAFAKRLDADFAERFAASEGAALLRWQALELLDMAQCVAALYRVTGNRRALADAIDKCIEVLEVHLVPGKRARDAQLAVAWHLRAAGTNLMLLRLRRTAHHVRKAWHHMSVFGEIFSEHDSDGVFEVLRSGKFTHWERKQDGGAGQT